MNRLTKTIESFTGDYRFLSNFWPCNVMYDGVYYPSTENAYQAAKFHVGERTIFESCTAGAAKRLGKDADIPDDWETSKMIIMNGLNYQKYDPTLNPELHDLLIATGDCDIIEGNTWGDVFWGECDGKGKNHLGRLLMRIREHYKEKLESVY